MGPKQKKRPWLCRIDQSLYYLVIHCCETRESITKLFGRLVLLGSHIMVESLNDFAVSSIFQQIKCRYSSSFDLLHSKIVFHSLLIKWIWISSFNDNLKNIFFNDPKTNGKMETFPGHGQSRAGHKILKKYLNLLDVTY